MTINFDKFVKHLSARSSMFKHAVIAAAVTFSLSHVTIAYAGPFGVEMGKSVDSLGGGEEVSPFLYSLKTPPVTHPDFEKVVVKAHPTTGVCEVRALGRNVQTSVYGEGLTSKFKDLREQISYNYGKNTLNDFLKAGSIWNDPKDWMMALLKRERVLQAVWDKKSGAVLKDNITEILLTALAIRNNVGYVILQYRFSNDAACDAAIKGSEAKAF